MVFNTPMSTINAINTGHGHMIAHVSVTNDGTFWRCGSASGFMGTGWLDLGALTPDTPLMLGYNYDTAEYGAWACRVVRVNRKSVTVKSQDTGKLHRVEV